MQTTIVKADWLLLDSYSWISSNEQNVLSYSTGLKPTFERLDIGDLAWALINNNRQTTDRKQRFQSLHG